MFGFGQKSEPVEINELHTYSSRYTFLQLNLIAAIILIAFLIGNLTGFFAGRSYYITQVPVASGSK